MRQLLLIGANIRYKLVDIMMTLFTVLPLNILKVLPPLLPFFKEVGWFFLLSCSNIPSIIFVFTVLI